MIAELISPNLHVVLIHYPLAMLIAGTLIECFSFLWPRSSFRTAGRWMILIGAMSAIPATFSGIYALRDVSRVDIDTDMHWAELKTASPVLSNPQIWYMLRVHTLIQSVATGAAALVVVFWLGASDRIRKMFYVTLMMLMIVIVGMIIRGSYFGGESIYRHGVAVEPVFPIATTQAAATTQPTNWMNTPTRAELLFPPLELHTIMAGIFTAIALVSIGLSFRRLTTLEPPPDEISIVTGDPSSALRTPRAPAGSFEMSRTFNPNITVEVKPFAPAGRFWMLAFLLALLTLLGGLFVTARGADLFTQMNNQPQQLPHLLWNQIKPGPGQKITRLVVHGATGSAIVILPIILALLTRYAPRERIILSIVTMCLIAAVALQVWMGVLLLFDTSDGPVTHFNPPVAADVSK